MNKIDFEKLRYNPGGFKISKKKVIDICKYISLEKKEVKMVKKNMKNIKGILLKGDTQPAKVISYDPLLIAIYSDEFDSILILKFPVEFAKKYQLSISQRMVCVNSYWAKEVFDIEPDIIPGKFSSNRWRDIIPLIPLFISEDENRCEVMTKIYPNLLWERFDYLVKEYLEKKPNQYRDGFKSLIYF